MGWIIFTSMTDVLKYIEEIDEFFGYPNDAAQTTTFYISHPNTENLYAVFVFSKEEIKFAKDKGYKIEALDETWKPKESLDI